MKRFQREQLFLLRCQTVLRCLYELAEGMECERDEQLAKACMLQALDRIDSITLHNLEEKHQEMQEWLAERRP